MSRVPSSLALALILAAALAACATPAATVAPSPAVSPSPGGDDQSPSPITTPPPTPTGAPTPTPAGSPSGVVVTFNVDGETYKILLTDPDLIEHAYGLLAGGEDGRIPNGLIVRGDPSVNAPWSWHIDPDSLEFADITMELCDGIPSFVEDGTLEGDRFCPWAAEVIDVQPAD